tara:strand:+ start:567 stop:917 length:351 start_codon:yes stop_codon:yes gene_type:complete
MGLSIFAQDVWVVPVEAKEIVNPYGGNQIAAQKGGMLFQKLCWTCHGKTGLGDGPAGRNLNPQPRNFKLESVQGQSDGELFWKISNGKGMMLPYKHSLNEEQRWQLVNFIRSFKEI